MTFPQSIRSVVWVILFAMVFLGVLLGIPGCGGGKEQASSEQLEAIKSKRKAEAEKDEAAHKKYLDDKKKKELAQKRNAEKKRKEVERQRQERLGRRNRKTEHPEFFEKWTDKDFYIAKLEQDRRLSKAIEYLAQQCQDTDRAVRLLGDLITPGVPLTEEERKELSISKSYRYDRQVKQLTEALVVKDTEKSKELIEKILSGETPTDARGVAIPTILNTIVQFPTPGNESIFLDAYRKSFPETDKLLRTIVDQGASVSFRKTLAEYSMTALCPEDRRQAIWKVLYQDDPKNLSAILLLYRNDRLPEEDRRTLEAKFARLSQSAVNQICGFPVSSKSKNVAKNRKAKMRRTSTIQGKPTNLSGDKDQETILVEQIKTNLWNETFAKLLARRLYRVNSLEKDSSLILLAMNTPCEESREMLTKLLLRNWQETPVKLRSIGFPEKTTVEPGFWVVAKKALKRSKADDREKRPIRSRAGKQIKMEDPLQLAWKGSFGRLLIAMCERFDTAGHPIYSPDEIAQRKESEESETSKEAETSPPPKWSMKSLLHPKARPVTEWKFKMPGDLLSIHYLRCEEVVQPETILKYYRNKLKDADELVGPRLCWLGTLAEEASTEEESTKEKNGAFQTADILLKIEPHSAKPTNISGKMELSVEILLISSE